MIKLKRAYDKPSEEDGFRVLVERLWPRGLTRERLDIDLWLKDVAPSVELRKWFSHEVPKWEEFRKRYLAELEKKREVVGILREKDRQNTVTLVYAAKDEEHNSAVVLKAFLEHSSP